MGTGYLTVRRCLMLVGICNPVLLSIRIFNPEIVLKSLGLMFSMLTSFHGRKIRDKIFGNIRQGQHPMRKTFGLSRRDH